MMSGRYDHLINMRPNKAELKYLTLSYDKFYDIYEEVLNPSFWRRSKYYRFCRVRDAFSIYAELLRYEPMGKAIDYVRVSRPPMEAEVGSELFKVVRNILVHFPVFESWEEVYIDKDLATWDKPNQPIDRFFTRYEGHEPIKYRFWQSEIKKMTYVSINFPNNYSGGQKIWLRDLISERDGAIFALIFMRRLLDTQVEEVKEVN